MPNLGSGNVIKNESFFRGVDNTYKKREILQARVELAQAYAHHPLKVACLPFHHIRF